MMYPASYKYQAELIADYNTIAAESRENQNKRVLQVLRERGTITQDDADNMKPRIKRLSARIFDLRNQGYEIQTDTICGKNEYGPTRYARYRMV